MKARTRSLHRSLLTGALIGGLLQAQQARPLPVPPLPDVPSDGKYKLFRDYQDRPVDPSRPTDSPRWQALTRGNQIYLSLQDAIALALENNLDIELQRYTPRLADTDIQRAEAGGFLRGLTLNVREGPAGVGGPRTQTVQGLSPVTDRAQDTSTSLNNNLPLSQGPAIPLLDPAIVGTSGYSRRNQPQTNEFISGTSSLRTNTLLNNIGVQKGFLTGGTFNVGFNNSRINQNSARADINPSTTGALSLSFVQPLLRGFGFAVNHRFIRVARNNRQVADLSFSQQVITTVFAVGQLYWDLVSLQEDLSVRRQTRTLSESLLSNNQAQVEAGTLAPIEVVRARAEVSRSTRDVVLAETLVRQQEAVLKDFLSRGSVADPLFSALHIITTDTIRVPSTDPVEPIQDLITRALQQRPDLQQARLQLVNSNVALRGTKSQLLPQLDLSVSTQTNSLVGQTNSIPPLTTTGSSTGTTVGGTSPGGTTLVRNPDPVFIGGYGGGLSQLFTGAYADYSVQLNLNIPLGNRIARSDLVRDRLAIRQQELRLQQVQKQIRLDVTNALIALEQARATYQATQETRTLQEQALEAEQQKYSVGASTNYLVIQYQRDLAQARSDEVTALGTYAKARNALNRATADILTVNNVSVEDAYRGTIKLGTTQ